MRLAIDCDLRKLFAVDSHGSVIAKAASQTDAIDDWTQRAPLGSVVLFEIASPVSFTRAAAGHAAMTRLAQWAIWNAVTAARLDRMVRSRPGVQFLVSPSNRWTRGLELKVRHKLAGAKQPQKDLRECETMLWSHAHMPGLWQPLDAYLLADVAGVPN